MYTNIFKHTNLVGVNISPGITYSAIKGGCGMGGGCRCSPGHWLSISAGVVDGVLNGMTIHFESRLEMDNFRQSIINETFNEEDLVSKGISSDYISLLIKYI